MHRGCVLFIGHAEFFPYAAAGTLQRLNQQFPGKAAGAVHLDAYQRDLILQHQFFNLHHLAAGDFVVVVEFRQFARKPLANMPVQMPARVGENQENAEASALTLPVATSHQATAPTICVWPSHIEQERFAYRISGWTLYSRIRSGIETNLANRFTVQLVLAVPFVDCAALFTAQQ
jgi:hypothetical protein